MSTELHTRVATRFGRPALQLLPTDRATGTFLGGAPIAATPFEWPRKDGRPLAFVGQLELGELSLADAAPWLPRSGRLLFFYDMDEWPWGFDPNDRGGWAVIHDTGTDAPRAVAFPADLSEEIRAPGIKHLEGRTYLSVPSLDRVSPEDLGISAEEEDDYSELASNLFDSHPMHQVGGFPEPVQSDDMERECQLALGGINCGEGHESPAAQALPADDNDWRLLLQLDSDDDLNLMWGDCGMVYFWIRERDARAGDFSSVWFVLQCY